MKNCQSVYESLNDFSDKCRICLQNYSDMTDIFASGISDQVMQVINIKITCDDRLPKRICKDCNRQLEKLHKFQTLAKDSDTYLRTLLLAEQSCVEESERHACERGRKKKRKLYRGCVQTKKKCGVINKSKELEGNLRDDKLYVIFVTESSNNSGGQNEICIKDLDVESENLELIDVCKSFVKSKSNDHTFQSEQSKRSCDSVDLQNTNKEEGFSCESKLFISENTVDRNIYKVNLIIYQCDECEEAFESDDYLLKHLMATHNIEVLSSSFKYWCPVCSMSENDKSLFLSHLRDHKERGFLFLKVDKNGENVPLKDIEEEIFEVPKFVERSNVKCKVFKMNTTCYTCFVCKKLESISTILDHLKECLPEFDQGGCFACHVKYTCPACCDTWIDDIENFNAHLITHKNDNVFFVKVDASGEPVDLTVDDIMFTTFEKALEILTFSREKSEDLSACDRKIIIKMQSMCSCSICDYEASSVSALSEHYLCIHGDVLPASNISCPVCCEEFKFIDVDERVKFCNHMKIHKNEGIYFLKVGGDGKIVNNSRSDCLGLFSDVNDFFTGKVPCPEMEYITDISAPQFFVQSTSHVVGGYLCELGQGDLSRKQGVVNNVKLEEKDLNRNSRDYMCEKCGRKCSGKGNYKRHFLTHSRKSDISMAIQRRPKCLVCAKAFSNRAALNEHRKHHLNEGTEDGAGDGNSPRVICEICGRRLSNNASLSKHRRLHAVNKESTLLRCKICERGFRRESALNRHVSAHLNPNYFECEICKLPLPSLASLQRHKLVHESTSDTFDCKVCKVSFLTKDRLAAHQTHTGHHQDRKRFECNVCHEKFFVGREFSQHIKMHPKYKMSECTLCGKRLSTMQSLMLHLGRHFESNSILCPHCGKQFFEERNYHRHLLTHKGVKPFSCEVEGCKKSFYTYFELNRHTKYHNNTRDFSCPYCPKSFHEANHLKVHIRTHTGERPYTCPHCNKGFVTRTRCKQHINLIHQGIGCDLIQSSISKKVAVFEALEKVA